MKKTLFMSLFNALLFPIFPGAHALDSPRVVKMVPTGAEPTASPHVIERGKPRVVTRGPSELIMPCGLPFTDPGCRVLSPDGREIFGHVRTEGEVCPWRVGDYTLRYVLMDGERELSSATLTVHVVPQKLPETVRPPKGTICLTFDDGPCEYTPLILDILKRWKVKACFFVVGFQKDYFDLLPRILKEGHTVGIHCFDHRAYDWLYQNVENYFSDLMQVQELIHDTTGRYAHVLRFPGGGDTASYLAATLEGGFAELYAMLADAGIRAYDWNVQAETESRSVEDTLFRFCNPPEPYEYAVVLQHDTNYASVASLERMIRWALSQGYRFAALEESFPEVHFND